MPTSAPAAGTAMSGDIVRLNVGGRVFCTSSATLLWPGDSTFFAGMLSGELPLCRDESGAISLDRDRDAFAAVLSFLRTQRVCMPG